MSAHYGIIFDKGADFDLYLVFENGEGVVVDMAGSSIVMQVRDGYDGPLIDELSTENGRVAFADVQGRKGLHLSFPAAVSAAWQAGRFVYDILRIEADGSRARLLEGPLTARPEVTRI